MYYNNKFKTKQYSQDLDSLEDFTLEKVKEKMYATGQEFWDGVKLTEEEIVTMREENEALQEETLRINTIVNQKRRQQWDAYNNRNIFERVYDAFDYVIFKPVSNKVSDVAEQITSGPRGLLEGIAGFYDNRYMYLIGLIFIIILIKKA